MSLQGIFQRRCHCFLYRFYSSEVKEPVQKSKNSRHSHLMRMNHFFKRNSQLHDVKPLIPKKYLDCKRKTLTDNLYLICPDIAKRIVSHVLPAIKSNSNQIVCETNAGLGFISSELLNNSVPLVRLYESCSEFRTRLKDFDKTYPGRVEIFIKDLFLLHRYSWMDKMDNCNRVEMLLKNVPNKKWTDDPCMTVIGPMSKLDFILYLLRILPLQMDIVTYGRLQMFAVMRPRDYIVLAATPENNLHTYKWTSVLFNLFFEHELLEKFPKDMFLPWESIITNKRITPRTRYPCQVDTDLMYLVKINFKKNLPVPTEDLLPLYFFVRNFFHRGRRQIIPTIEKWVPGSGLNVLVPKLNHENYFENIGIFTEFGQLTVEQILNVFLEVRNCETYDSSPFKAMIESHLMKLETIETDLNDNVPLHKILAEEIEVKLNNDGI